MTTATASDLSAPLLCGRNHFLLRRLHSLTGIMFGSYLVVHLVVNASLIQGHKPDVFQMQVDKIHSLPFLLGIEWMFIFLPILFHAVYGTWIAITAKWNVDRYPYEKNYFYVLQRLSAFVLIAFILFHVLGMKDFFGGTLAFDADHATGSTARHINASWFLAFIVYPIGVLASAYHTANGFWTAAITWGLTTSAASQRRWGFVCAGIGAVLLVCGLLALTGAISDAGSINQLLTTAPVK